MYHNIKFKEAVKNIESKNDIKIVEGIKLLRESGKPEAVELITNLLRNEISEEVKKECTKFLNDIKDQFASKYIVEEINKNTDKELLGILVSCAWQNNLDFSEYMETFARIVLQEEYLIAFEAFTVIENNIDRLPADKANHIEDIISKGLKSVNKEKQLMIKELIEVIKDVKKTK